MAAKASINFKGVKNNSEHHNERKSELSYVHPELIKDNQHWKPTFKNNNAIASVAEMTKRISKSVKDKTGRGLYKNAEPIKEAVINLLPHHSLDDLQKLSESIYKRFKIRCFQIHIHRDEGLKDELTGDIKINHHAHMLFYFHDFNTGKMIRLKPKDLSQMQTLVAKELGMERGELRENSNTERLEALEYKAAQERLKLIKLRDEVSQLQKEKERVNQEVIKLVGIWDDPQALRNRAELLEKVALQKQREKGKDSGMKMY